MATELEIRAAEIILGRKDAVSGTPSEPYAHGPGGLFSAPAMEREFLSTVVRPKGLVAQLPAFPTVYMTPYFGFITSFDDVTGEEADGPCDDPPTAGQMNVCRMTADFGLYSRQTRVLDIRRAGQLINRGEFTDYQLINSPLLEALNNITPSVPGGLNLQREQLVRQLELGFAFQRQLGRQLYIGDPSNNTSGGYMEFSGLDLQIKTGINDAIHNTACPSLDSQLKDMQLLEINSTNAAAYVARITAMMRYFWTLAEDTGLDPVEEVIAMRRSAFYALTAVWPCAYNTYRCDTGNSDQSYGDTVVIDGRENVAMTEAMRAGQYLLIDNQHVPVILDSFIVEEDHAANGSVTEGSFASDFYFLPLSVGGNFRSLYLQYYDFAAGPITAAVDAGVRGFYEVTDGGRFIWHAPPPTNWCVQQRASIQPRLVLRTPHLAGKMQNVMYTPLLHERDPLPDDPAYIGGGSAVV